MSGDGGRPHKMKRLPDALPARGDWDLDLTTGEIAQETLRRLLTHKAGGDRVHIEVKNDRIVKSSGNLFVEFEYKGQPSGINKTKAEWWATTAENHGQDVFMLMRVPWLKARLSHLLKTGAAFITEGGDNRDSKGVLVKVHDLWSDRP